LGAGAVNALLAGTTGALITRQGADIVPIPFADLMDPETGRTRVRMVDVDTETFRSALALQRRVTAEDLADQEKLGAIAAAAGLSPAEARERYAPLA
jgi:6-phosphofructokinase 1